jgi:hypothetical protein
VGRIFPSDRNELFEEAKEKAHTHVQALLQPLKNPVD